MLPYLIEFTPVRLPHTHVSGTMSWWTQIVTAFYKRKYPLRLPHTATCLGWCHNVFKWFSFSFLLLTVLDYLTLCVWDNVMFQLSTTTSHDVSGMMSRLIYFCLYYFGLPHTTCVWDDVLSLIFLFMHTLGLPHTTRVWKDVMSNTKLCLFFCLTLLVSGMRSSFWLQEFYSLFMYMLFLYSLLMFWKPHTTCLVLAFIYLRHLCLTKLLFSSWLCHQ